MMDEVRLAVDLGLDGFCYDILGTQGTHWNRLLLLLDAAQKVDPGFKIMLMPDMMAELRSKPERLGPAILEVARHPSILRDERDRLVLAPYMANCQSLEWWQAVFADLRKQGVEVKFVPLFQAWWKYADEYAPISDGFSDWGAATVDEVMGGRRTSPQKCHAYGKLWMAPIRPQDFRPKSCVAWEAANTELFRSMWQIAIEGQAEWAQVITWNDYSEASEIAPSTETRRGFYDLTAYYTTWFKDGRAPAIVRDAIYGTYRVQPTDGKPDPARQPKPMKVVGTPSDRIELLAFLTAPGTLEIEVGGKVSRQEAPAGITSFKTPLTAGTPVFRLVRNNAVKLQLTGARAIALDNIVFQDLLYRADGVVAQP